MLVARKVLVDGTATGYGVFSASPSGTIAYRTSAGNLQLVWLDRSGARVGTVGEANDSQQVLRYLAHDGRSVAVVRFIEGNSDVWLIDTARGTSQRFTTDPGTDGEPVLSHDGNSVVYVWTRETTSIRSFVRDPTVPARWSCCMNPARTRTRSTGLPMGIRLVLEPGCRHRLGSAGAAAVARPQADRRRTIEVQREQRQILTGRQVGRVWIRGVGTERSVRAGISECRAQATDLGRRRRFPRWRRDGRELYYFTPAAIDSWRCRSHRTGASLDISTPRYLFTVPPRGSATSHRPTARSFWSTRWFPTRHRSASS